MTLQLGERVKFEEGRIKLGLRFRPRESMRPLLTCSDVHEVMAGIHQSALCLKHANFHAAYQLERCQEKTMTVFDGECQPLGALNVDRPQ